MERLATRAVAYTHCDDFPSRRVVELADDAELHILNTKSFERFLKNELSNCKRL